MQNLERRKTQRYALAIESREEERENDANADADETSLSLATPSDAHSVINTSGYMPIYIPKRTQLKKVRRENIYQNASSIQPHDFPWFFHLDRSSFTLSNIRHRTLSIVVEVYISSLLYWVVEYNVLLV